MTHVDDPAFSRLPLELVSLIVGFAAAPEFHSDGATYACGLSLCCVSKTTRRAALQSMLHTVFLAGVNSVPKFVTALRLQKTFAQTNSTLFIDYTLYVSKIWITQYHEPPPPRAPSASQSFHPATPPSDMDGLRLLAPVILGAPSLLFDESSMSLLCHCLALVWGDHTTESLRSPSLPWRTQKLTLLGRIPRWLPITSSPEGSAFLASIRSLAVLPEIANGREFSKKSWLEACRPLQSIPLESFPNLRKLVVPLVSFPFSVGAHVNGRYINIQLLAIEVPTTGSKPGTRQWINDAIEDAHLEGRTTEFTIAYLGSFEWEQCWSDHIIGD